jgi:hypothetical protein
LGWTNPHSLRRRACDECSSQSVLNALMDTMWRTIAMRARTYSTLPASGRTDVRGLVYTAAYVPDSGETINSLSVGFTPGAFLAHLTFAPSFPFVIVDPQFFPEDFAQNLNPKLGAEIAAEQVYGPAR